MSQPNNNFDLFDPTGMVKSFRDAGLDAWAKSMVELVNTEAYAEANGTMLDAWLSSSAPFRNAMESAMRQALASLNLPSRDEVSGLAERLTNIEIRLDDLDAKLDEALLSIRKNSTGRKAGSPREEK
jgi:hypothetical protein